MGASALTSADGEVLGANVGTGSPDKSTRGEGDALDDPVGTAVVGDPVGTRDAVGDLVGPGDEVGDPVGAEDTVGDPVGVVSAEFALEPPALQLQLAATAGK
mmetsp:Transcript_23082/g.64527  ORF Transcript_23082/g.64527 Transcript_23082/m.64527 type:complete len:102 (+) Transcript_23082:408-713(+)